MYCTHSAVVAYIIPYDNSSDLETGENCLGAVEYITAMVMSAKLIMHVYVAARLARQACVWLQQ